MNIAILSGNDVDARFENSRIIEELRILGCHAYVIDYLGSTVLNYEDHNGLQIVTAGEAIHMQPDAVITRINEPDQESVASAKRFLGAIESLSIPATVSSAAVDICKDKISTHDKLVAAGIPTPRTAAMPTESYEANGIIPLLEYVEPNPNRPVIIKKIHGTKGIGVARAGTRRSALPFIQMLIDSKVPILAQQYIETKRNGLYRDIRHVVIGETVVAAMLREASNDFRTNLSLNTESEGGISDARGRKCRISRHHSELSIGAAMAIGAPIVGVDILPSIHGGAFVDDVNSSPGLRIEQITDKNVARAIARYAISIARPSAQYII